MRKTAQIAVGLIISLLALWLAFRGADLTQMAGALRNANYFYLVPAALLTFLGLIFRALSWRVILDGRVPYRRVFDAMNEGYLLNSVLPLRLGELGRAYLISHNTPLTVSQALSSVVVERVIDLLMLFVLLAAFLPLVAGLGIAQSVAIGAMLTGLAALVILVVLARSRTPLLRLVRAVFTRLHLKWLDPDRWEGRIGSFLDGLSVLRDGRRAGLAAFWSGMAWVAAGYSAWLLLLAFVPTARVAMGFFALTIVGLGNAVPSAPSSAGVFEFVVVQALALFAVEHNTALSYALVFHAVQIGLILVFGGLALSGEGESIGHLAQAAQALLTRGRAPDQAAAVPATDAAPEQ